METRSQEAVVWVLEISGIPGQPVRCFSNVGFHGQAAGWPLPIEPRIVGVPSEFTVQAMTQEPGALPELPQLTITLHNGDGSLSRMLLGSTVTAEEFAHPCIVGGWAFLYFGVFGPGETPKLESMRDFGMMYISGPIQIEGHTVALTLAAVDRLSESELSLWTAGEVAGAELVKAMVNDDSYSQWWGGSLAELWGWCAGAMQKAPHVVVPVVFGSTLHKGVSLGVSELPASYVWGIDTGGDDSHPGFYVFGSDGYCSYDGALTFTHNLKQMGVRVASFRLRLTDRHGRSRRFWLHCLLDIGPQESGYQKIDRPLQVWPDMVGNDHKGPADTMRAVAEWMQTGAIFDAPSLTEVIALQEDAYANTVSGVLAAAAPMQSLASQMSLLGDLRYYMTNGRIGVAVGDIPQKAIEAAKGDLPHIRAMDVLPADSIGTPAFKEQIPAGPDDANAALARVIIDWPDDFRRLRPLATATDRLDSTNINASPLSELRIPGEWISPWAAGAIIDQIADRALFPTRMVEVTTRLSALHLEVGQFIRISCTIGLTAEGGPWVRRLCRVERITALPADAACRLLVRDLGPLEEMKLGKLDSLSNWVMHVPTVGSVWRIDKPGGGVSAVIELPYALPGDRADYIDATIWTPGDSRESRQRSWRIRGMRQVGGRWLADVVASESVPSDGAAVSSITVTTGSLLSCEVLVMRTHMQAGAGFRPDYVRGAASDGFYDGERGYQYTP